jgi:hypothetical protein
LVSEFSRGGNELFGDLCHALKIRSQRYWAINAEQLQVGMENAASRSSPLKTKENKPIAEALPSEACFCLGVRNNKSP